VTNDNPPVRNLTFSWEEGKYGIYKATFCKGLITASVSYDTLKNQKDIVMHVNEKKLKKTFGNVQDAMEYLEYFMRQLAIKLTEETNKT